MDISIIMHALEKIYMFRQRTLHIFYKKHVNITLIKTFKKLCLIMYNSVLQYSKLYIQVTAYAVSQSHTRLLGRKKEILLSLIK